MNCLFCRGRFLAVATGAVAMSSQVQAFQATDLLAFSTGPVTLRSRAALSETYNDNVFYQNTAPGLIGDFITTASVGMSASLGREVAVNPWLDFFEDESNFVSLNYDLDYLFYASLSELNTDNHSFDFKNRWRGDRLTIKGGDSMKLMTGLIGGGYTTAQKLNVTRLLYYDNYMVDYALSQKTRIYLNGLHSSTDYEKGTPLYDDNTLRATTGFGYQAFAKTSLFGEVYYGQSAVDPNLPPAQQVKGPHATFVGGFLGAQGYFTPHLSGMLKAGYESQQFSDNSPAPTSPVVDASLTHRFRAKTMTTLTYSRHNVVSVQSAGVSSTTDSIGLRLDQRLGTTDRWTASVGGTLDFGDYGESRYYTNRQDNWYRLSANLAYLIRAWMRANMGYEFQKFASSGTGIIDYDVNRVTLTLSVGY